MRGDVARLGLRVGGAPASFESTAAHGQSRATTGHHDPASSVSKQPIRLGVAVLIVSTMSSVARYETLRQILARRMILSVGGDERRISGLSRQPTKRRGVGLVKRPMHPLMEQRFLDVVTGAAGDIVSVLPLLAAIGKIRMLLFPPPKSSSPR